jgi:hypothetical protein
MNLPDLDSRLREAVRLFWLVRQRQRLSGATHDKGARSAATGGRQMDGFVHLVRHLLLEAGAPESSIFTDTCLELPGWFRAEKQWDLVVVRGKELVAALEFKSHVGPSFGNNFNNRTEEALGSATDIWAAYREGAFQPSARPFLGYLMLLEDAPGSRSPVKIKGPHFPVFPEFAAASYARRYEILVEKLLRERLYDGACLLLSSAESASGDYREPHPELTFAKFIQPLLARVSALRA